VKSFYSPGKKLILVLTTVVFGFSLFCLSGAFGEGEPESEVMGEGRCAIKGEINSRGQRIYYLPECANYERVVVDKLVGEEWFCGEEEAIQAGFTLSPSC
jgi:hypothetical protein